MKWKKEKETKIEDLRTQLKKEGKFSMDMSIGGATVGAHIDS
jgi:hypothetical protein